MSFLLTASTDEEPNEHPYIGQNSIIALLKGEASSRDAIGSSEHEQIRQGVLPIFGLEPDPATYPLMSNEHMKQIKLDIGRDLPDDKFVLSTLNFFKQKVQPSWELLLDMEDFEAQLRVYLDQRSAILRYPNSGVKGVSSAWLGTLFGVLAVSVQFSDEPYAKRTKQCQEYGASSPIGVAELIFAVTKAFHCLRLANYLIRPSFESLQAMLIINFAMANDWKTDAAWSFLGIICRLSQTLGYHRAPHEACRRVPDRHCDLAVRKLWYVTSQSRVLIS